MEETFSKPLADSPTKVRVVNSMTNGEENAPGNTNDLFSKVSTVTVFILWLVVSLYFGIGGILRANLDETLQKLETNREILTAQPINIQLDGFTLHNQYEVQKFLEASSVETGFPWAVKISSFTALLITAFAFGILGALVGLIKEVAMDSVPVTNLKVWSVPIFGLFIGLIVFGLSYLLPTVLVKSEQELRPISLMFLCLFAGIYSKNFYEKLTSYFDKLFL